MLTAMAPDWDKLFPQIGSGNATVVQYGLYCIPSCFLAYMYIYIYIELMHVCTHRACTYIRIYALEVYTWSPQAFIVERVY